MRTSHPLHLAWAVPLVLVIDAVMLFLASFGWCGISGCSGGGFGIYRNAPFAFGSLIVSGIATGSILYLAPWTKRKVLKRWVAIGAGATAFGLGLLRILML